MGVEVRLLGPGDIRGLTPATFTLAPIFDRLEAYAGEKGGLFVGEVDGAPAACAAVVREGDTLRVEQFAVSPRARGHGLGSRMMKAVIDHARGLGLTRIRAEAPGWCPDWRAFYTRLGFTYLTQGSMSEMATVERILT
jgi:GNAT superfamily N-acetyltransferase